MTTKCSDIDVVVIGAGPAGLMAACFAAERGLSVAVIEKNDLIAKKLRITGKGRCNLTNDCDEEEFLRNVRRGEKFMYSSIRGFSSRDVIRFFESRGLPLVTERGNRVFPKSQKAADVAEVLIKAVKDVGATIRKGNVKEVLTENGAVSGVTTDKGETIFCKAVIVATGGISYPKTGSTGDGYRIAKKYNHRVEKPLGSLVPIVCDNDESELQGLSLRNVELTAKKGDRILFSEQGEMLFTHFGVSGPLVLTMSSHLVGEDLREIRASVDLKPALERDVLDKRVLRDFSKNSNRDFKNSLDELLPKKMIPVVIKRSGIDPEKKVRDITAIERSALIDTIKQFRLSLSAFRPVEEAIVTAGGVCLDEINPKTMMSKKVDNLYFSGEVLDVDAYTGGFNLGIAFATGAAAGKYVLQEPKKKKGTVEE